MGSNPTMGIGYLQWRTSMEIPAKMEMRSCSKDEFKLEEFMSAWGDYKESLERIRSKGAMEKVDFFFPDLQNGERVFYIVPTNNKL